MRTLTLPFLLLALLLRACAGPTSHRDWQQTFDLQAHRGGRGETVESTLASFAWGLINGVKTLELDNGITKDGAVIVWHDESIDPTKCIDTKPVTPEDPNFPYVGKYIANLTLAQIKTLDCGSKWLDDFLFDWRSLIQMREKDQNVTIAALVSLATAFPQDNSTTKWLAGLHPDSWQGTVGEQLAQAAASIGADILSPAGVSDLSPADDPSKPGFLYFTTEDMIVKAHDLGLEVKPWTINRLNIAEQLLDWGIDGIITDYPHVLKRLLRQQKYEVEKGFPRELVMECFKARVQYV